MRSHLRFRNFFCLFVSPQSMALQSTIFPFFFSFFLPSHFVHRFVLSETNVLLSGRQQMINESVFIWKNQCIIYDDANDKTRAHSTHTLAIFFASQKYSAKRRCLKKEIDNGNGDMLIFMMKLMAAAWVRWDKERKGKIWWKMKWIFFFGSERYSRYLSTERERERENVFSHGQLGNTLECGNIDYD